MDVGAFLRDAGARQRVAGAWDCATFPADWAVACGYPDPMGLWRGTYDSEAGAEVIIANTPGGLAQLFESGMRFAGIPEASAPYLPGDIGLVELLGEEAGCVYTGRRWAFVASRGLACATIGPEFVKRAWRVTHG